MTKTSSLSKRVVSFVQDGIYSITSTSPHHWARARPRNTNKHHHRYHRHRHRQRHRGLGITLALHPTPKQTTNINPRTRKQRRHSNSLFQTQRAATQKANSQKTSRSLLFLIYGRPLPAQPPLRHPHPDPGLPAPRLRLPSCTHLSRSAFISATRASVAHRSRNCIMAISHSGAVHASPGSLIHRRQQQ